MVAERAEFTLMDIPCRSSVAFLFFIAARDVVKCREKAIDDRLKGTL